MIERPSAKDILGESLLQLVKKTPINKVTIDMIVNNCGYSKKTFYNHFPGKYELAYWIFEKQSNNIISEYIGTESWGSVLGRIYRFMYENRNLFGSSWDKDDLDLHVGKIIDYCDRYYAERLVSLHGENALTPETRFLLKFNGYGATHMVIDWITHNWKQTPEEMGRYMADAIPEELAALLQLD
jgi:AcrR family transcriptional regulator